MTSFGGQWTEEKLEILRRYLDAYTTALKGQPFDLAYVDAFAGEGYWQPNTPYVEENYADFEEVRKGSATIALEIDDKPFDRFVFIEKDLDRCESLERLKEEFPTRSIEINNADANDALSKFCDELKANERAVVFLDPFATSVSWTTVAKLADTKKIDCWILFPLGAIARLMPTNQEPPESWASNLDRVFGGRDYWQGLYQTKTVLTLFGDEDILERPGGSGPIADSYRSRLEDAFERVAPTSRVFRNSRNSPMFEMFFAASNPHGAQIAVRIANHILENW